jgi:hypothetical protein
MESSLSPRNLSRAYIILGLLESVARNGSESQRARADEFGVALGLVNAYLNYCIQKGLIRVRKIPARRYGYFLTPKGFSEKSRLAAQLVSNSLHSFRLARLQYAEGFRLLHEKGCSRILLVGLSELTDIAAISATEKNVDVIGIWAVSEKRHYVGLPVSADIASFGDCFDAAAITDLADPGFSYTQINRILAPEKIVLPSILGTQNALQV